MSKENGGAARGGNDEIGGKRAGKMIAVVLDGIGREIERKLRRRDRAENLRQLDAFVALMAHIDLPRGARVVDLGGGSGWVVLTRSARDGSLSNVWSADHTHALAGGTPLLALDRKHAVDGRRAIAS